MNKKQNYSLEFKRKTAQLVLEQGYTQKRAAEVMQVSSSTVRTWLSQYQQGLLPEPINLTAMSAPQEALSQAQSQVNIRQDISNIEQQLLTLKQNKLVLLQAIAALKQKM